MGYPFRSGLRNDVMGSYAVIQMKDLSRTNRVDCSSLIRIDLNNIKPHHLVKQNDLIFRSRGQITTTAIFVDNLGDAIVAAPLIRIRVTDHQILPEYLNWYFSQKKTQNWFAARREGTHGGMISKTTLENLEVDIPYMENQKKILKIDALLKKENELTEKLGEKRNLYVSTLLMQLAKGE